jgi:hypothetical protein
MNSVLMPSNQKCYNLNKKKPSQASKRSKHIIDRRIFGVLESAGRCKLTKHIVLRFEEKNWCKLTKHIILRFEEKIAYDCSLLPGLARRRVPTFMLRCDARMITN